MFFKIPDWIPSKKDQIGYRNDEFKMLEKDIVPALMKFLELSKEVEEAKEKLTKTFTKDQYNLWMDCMTLNQKLLFQNNHVDYMKKRKEEIPKEITELSF